MNYPTVYITALLEKCKCIHDDMLLLVEKISSMRFRPVDYDLIKYREYKEELQNKSLEIEQIHQEIVKFVSIYEE